MPLSYSLLVPPLAPLKPQRPWLWPQVTDPPVAPPNAPVLFPYVFRAFWQPQRLLTWPVPGDLAVPGPLVPQYAFRRGGFWVPQQRWGIQPPADIAFPNAPVLRPYLFRPGGLWRMPLILVPGVPPLIFTPWNPPPIGVPTGEVTGNLSPTMLGSPSGEVTGSSNPAPIGTPTN